MAKKGSRDGYDKVIRLLVDEVHDIKKVDGRDRRRQRRVR